MSIKKYLHSCLLLEESGRRLLIDPGSFSFIEKRIAPEDIGGVDVILITHKHPDHYWPEALKIITGLKPAPILAHKEICTLLKEEGLACKPIAAGDVKEVAGFTIEAFEAPHGPIAAELPQNLAFLINKTLLHPGDSLDIEGITSCKVLALPITAPWLRLVDALDFAQKLKPEVVTPIHDAIMKDFMLERVYQMCDAKLSEWGITFKPIGLAEKLAL